MDAIYLYHEKLPPPPKIWKHESELIYESHLCEMGGSTPGESHQDQWSAGMPQLEHDPVSLENGRSPKRL